MKIFEEEQNMSAQELILRYRIVLKVDEHGQPTGNLVVYRAAYLAGGTWS